LGALSRRVFTVTAQRLRAYHLIVPPRLGKPLLAAFAIKAILRRPKKTPWGQNGGHICETFLTRLKRHNPWKISPLVWAPNKVKSEFNPRGTTVNFQIENGGVTWGEISTFLGGLNAAQKFGTSLNLNSPKNLKG